MGDKGKTVSNDDIYTLLKSISDQNTEIKQEITLIRTQMNTLDHEISKVKQVNVRLNEENRTLKIRLQKVERLSRENNLILYNIEDLGDEQLFQQIVELVGNRLGIPLNLHDISNLYRLGKKSALGKNRPIILKLTSYLKKKEILGNASRLKGTRIGISEDLTEEQREQKKIIYDHYKAARGKNYPAKLYNSGVSINGIFYRYEDLKNQEPLIQHTDGIPGTSFNRRSTSAPSSPNRNIGVDQAFTVSGSKPAEVHLSQDRLSNSEQGNSAFQTTVETRSRTDSKSSTSSLDRAVKNKKTSKK